MADRLQNSRQNNLLLTANQALKTQKQTQIFTTFYTHSVTKNLNRIA